MPSLERLLRPRSIAAIGGIYASRVIEQCQKMGYAGEIWPVHPHKTEVAGLPAYASIEDLPDSPDAAFIGINRELTIEAVQILCRIGAGGAVCYASGFLEADAIGAELQTRLVDAAGDMPIIGPNCYGLINYADAALLWPDQQGGRRLEKGQSGVAIITQSSNIAINFTMQTRGLPLAFVGTVGNQAQVGMSQLASSLLDDQRITTLGLHIEGFDSIEGMERLALKARSLGKPIVVFKVGRSEQAHAVTLSHTASLAGSQAAANAFLSRNGFGQAHSIPVFLEALKLLHTYGPLEGYRFSSMSCSGGEASIMADAAVGRKVYFPGLDESHRKSVEAVVGPRVTVSNPLDYHTYCWGQRDTLQAAYAAMTGIGFDFNLLILDFPHPARCESWEWMIAAEAFAAALQENRAKGALVASMAENISERYSEALIQKGNVCLYGFNEALQAGEIAADIGSAWRGETPPPILKPSHSSGPTRTLDEAEAKQVLARHKVPIPQNALIDSTPQLVTCAAKLGYPLALKVLGIAHKTEAQAVYLGIQSAAELTTAASNLFRRGDRLYLERMVESVIAELFVGIIHDPQFGLLLTLGSGGILVEILRDSRTLLLPVSRKEVEQALTSLKSAPLIQGYRGRPEADLASAVDAVMAIQQYAISEQNRLVELDINPLLLCAKGEGVYAADALIVLQQEE